MRGWRFLLVIILSLITTAVRAETIDISDDRGGFVHIAFGKQTTGLDQQGLQEFDIVREIGAARHAP